MEKINLNSENNEVRENKEVQNMGEKAPNSFIGGGKELRQ